MCCIILHASRPATWLSFAHDVCRRHRSRLHRRSRPVEPHSAIVRQLRPHPFSVTCGEPNMLRHARDHQQNFMQYRDQSMCANCDLIDRGRRGRVCLLKNLSACQTRLILQWTWGRNTMAVGTQLMNFKIDILIRSYSNSIHAIWILQDYLPAQPYMRAAWRLH